MKLGERLLKIVEEEGITDAVVTMLKGVDEFPAETCLPLYAAIMRALGDSDGMSIASAKLQEEAARIILKFSSVAWEQIDRVLTIKEDGNVELKSTPKP